MRDQSYSPAATITCSTIGSRTGRAADRLNPSIGNQLDSARTRNEYGTASGTTTWRAILLFYATAPGPADEWEQPGVAVGWSGRPAAPVTLGAL